MKEVIDKMYDEFKQRHPTAGPDTFKSTIAARSAALARSGRTNAASAMIIELMFWEPQNEQTQEKAH